MAKYYRRRYKRRNYRKRKMIRKTRRRRKAPAYDGSVMRKI